MLRYRTDRARPGLVTLYDIRPGNGAGQFAILTKDPPEDRRLAGGTVHCADSATYQILCFRLLGSYS